MPAALTAPQRAASAYPAVPQRHLDSPSPTKKRRVDTGSGSRSAPRPEPYKLHSIAHKPHSSHLPAPHSTTPQARLRATTDVEEGDADPNDPELRSRLHSSTLKLRDAWDDILRRHSLPAPSPAAPSRAPASSPTRRHRPAGRTRAIPVEEDDIIDLRTMEIVHDRGVLRRSRAGAFALGGYTDALDDVLVGPDTGVGEVEQGGGSGEEPGAAGGDSFEEDDDADEPNALDSEAYAGSSDDELGDMDELPSLPSLLFREQRRRAADRRDQLRDFWEHEARARGASEAGGAAPDEGGDAVGNRTLEAFEAADDDDELGFFAPAPSVGPSPASRPRRSSSSPLQVEVSTPSRKLEAQSHAPSTTAALRTAVGAVQLASSSPTRPRGSTSSARYRPRSSAAAVQPDDLDLEPRSSSVTRVHQDELEKTSEKKRKKRKPTRDACAPHEKQGPCTSSADLSLEREAAHAASQPTQALQTPPNSFTARRLSVPSARSLAARPPVSSSPLRDVIAVASPSPTTSPEPALRSPIVSPSPSLSPSPRPPVRQPAEPSRSPSLEIIYPRARVRSPSLAVWTAPARTVSPELGIPAPPPPARLQQPSPAQHQVYQHPTPTPTPPPVPPAPSARVRRARTAAAAGQTPTPPKKGKGPRHSFELVIDRKPSRMSMTPRPGAPTAVQPASSERGARSSPRTAAAKVDAIDVEMRSPGGLATPPLSKRSSRAARPAPASAPSRSSVVPAVEPGATSSKRKGKSKPGHAGSQAAAALRAAAKAESQAKVEAEQDDVGLDDDPLLLESSPSPVKRAATVGPRAQLRRAMTAVPVSPAKSSSSRVQGRRMTTVAPSPSRDEEGSDDDDGPLPTVATLAPSLVEVAPLHAVQLLHLVVSLSFTCHALAVLSYLLSPSHVVLLVLRVALLVQFSNPRRTHPTRSLRFFTALWALQAVGTTAVHALTGSRGTKGPRGHAQGGIVLDFVGVAATPSTLHLVLIDVLLALFQLATVLVAFGATVPNDLDASVSGEGARDYSALLGLGAGAVEDDDEEEDVRVRAPSRRSRARKRRGYESVPGGEEDEDEFEIDGLDGRHEEQEDAFGLGTFKPPPASSSSSSRLGHDPSAQYVRLPLIADLRLRTVWAEVRKSATQVDTERVDAGVRELEEGRGA